MKLDTTNLKTDFIVIGASCVLAFAFYQYIKGYVPQGKMKSFPMGVRS